MFPAQALAEEMLDRGWRVKLLTDARGARYATGFPAAVRRSVTPSASFSQGGWGRKLAAPFLILFGVVAAVVSMLRDRPAAVAGFGGYPALPAMVAATMLRIPRLIHEQNARLGTVNRLFVSRVQAVAIGCWPAEVPGDVEVYNTGNPVRAGIRARAGAPYISPGDWPMDLLVIGGSQGARTLSTVVPAALALLPEAVRERLTVAHQAREDDAAAARAAYDDLGMRAEIRPFFDDIPDRLAEAQLVISRAGASSIADISVIGRPAILIPYPHATGDHQTANARGLVEAGGAFMIAESELTPELLAGHIAAIIEEPDGANAFARAALAYGKPQAAAMLADLIDKIVFEARQT